MIVALCRCLELNLAPPVKQSVLKTAELYVQPCYFILLLLMHIYLQYWCFCFCPCSFERNHLQRFNMEGLKNRFLGFFRSQENNVLLFVEFVDETTEIGHFVDREKCLFKGQTVRLLQSTEKSN